VLRWHACIALQRRSELSEEREAGERDITKEHNDPGEKKRGKTRDKLRKGYLKKGLWMRREARLVRRSVCRREGLCLYRCEVCGGKVRGRGRMRCEEVEVLVR
jgi:hypothetical protein